MPRGAMMLMSLACSEKYPPEVGLEAPMPICPVEPTVTNEQVSCPKGKTNWRGNCSDALEEAVANEVISVPVDEIDRKPPVLVENW